MLSRKRYELARSVGIAVAHSNFVTFLNPKYRGPRFAWSDIYRFTDGRARIHVDLMGDFGRDQKAMEEVSAEAAKFTLDMCFKESDVKTWLPLSPSVPEP